MKLNLTSSSFLSFFPCTTSSPEACTTGSYHEAGVDVTFVLSSIFAFFRLRVLIQGVFKRKGKMKLNRTSSFFLSFLPMHDLKSRGRVSEEEKQKETRNKVGYRHKRMKHRAEAHPQPN